jgi:predicted HicB family RNase H-like nuclease
MRRTERKEDEKRAEPAETEAGTETVPFATRARQVYERAESLVSGKSDWIAVFREIFGPNGIAREYFETAEEMEQFEQTLEFRAIRQFISQMRDQAGDTAERVATRMITVRIPKSLHESLRTEAHTRKTSLNKLCIWKLLQSLDDDPII